MATTITVKCSERKGAVKPMNCVNNGPAGSAVRKTGNFLTYRAARFPYARLHDSAFYTGYGGEFSVDVHRIFRNFDADPEDPASYIFEPTDKYLDSIKAAGTEIFYRLGAAIEHEYKFGTYPPKDYLKWAKICEHIIRHYNEGWANGFYFNIEYWEIWNEFDCHNSDGSHPNWQGTFSEFAEFYSVVARYLKNVFPDLKIGGPAFASVWDPAVNETFFSVMRRDNVPIDFVSYHAYMRRVQDLRDNVSVANKVFAQYGYGGAEKILNEYNYVKGWAAEEWQYSLRSEKGLKGASFAAACMAEGQRLNLDMLMYYDARPCGMNGLFDTDTLAPLKSYYAFTGFAALRELGESVFSESNDADIYVCAAENGEKRAIYFTYYKDADEGEDKLAAVRISGVSAPCKAVIKVTDKERNAETIREEIINSEECTLYIGVKLFDIYLIELLPPDKDPS